MTESKKIIVEFYYEVRGFQTFEVPTDYEVSEVNPNDAYDTLLYQFGLEEDCIKCNPIDVNQYGGGKGMFKGFGDIIEVDEEVNVVDFEFNQIFFEEEGIYSESKDDEK